MPTSPDRHGVVRYTFFRDPERDLRACARGGQRFASERGCVTPGYERDLMTRGVIVTTNSVTFETRPTKLQTRVGVCGVPSIDFTSWVKLG